MQDKERDRMLRGIDKNAAVTRTKVEQLCDEVETVKETQDEHRDRLNSTERRSKNNSRVLAGVSTGVGAILVVIFEQIVRIL